MQISGVPLELQEVQLIYGLSSTYVNALRNYQSEENKDAPMPFMTEEYAQRVVERHNANRRQSMLARQKAFEEKNGAST